MPRVAVSGWFHGEPLTTPMLAPLLFPPLPPAPVSGGTLQQLHELMTPLYHTPPPELVRKMRRRGAIACAAFLRDPIDAQVRAQRWVDVGPLHVRFYQRCPEPIGALARVSELLCSGAFREWAEQLVGVRLSPATLEVRRFERGQHYTLLHDAQEPRDAPMLHVVYCLSDAAADGQWDTDHGAYVSFIDSADGAELISAVPLSNCLSLTLAEPGVEPFVKYVSHYAPSDRIDVELRFGVVGVLPGLEDAVDDDDDDDEEEDGEDEDEAAEGQDEEEGAGNDGHESFARSASHKRPRE